MRVLLLIFGIISSPCGAATEIYVSPNGNDSNSGASNSPLKTLGAAKNKVRTIVQAGLPTGGIRVNFAGGTYPYSSATVLSGSADSGASGKPIIYRPWGGANVTFDGTKDIGNSGWSVTSDSKLAPVARGKVYVKSITDSRLRQVLGSRDPRLDQTLLFDGKLMPGSRFPNVGYAHVDNITSQQSQNGQQGTTSNPVGPTFTLMESPASSWSMWQTELNRFASANKHRATIVGYISADWWKEHIGIHSCDSSGRIRLKDAGRYGFRDHPRGWENRMFVKFLLCEIDTPGEWAYDSITNQLYVWPRSPITSSTSIKAGTATGFIDLQSVSHVWIENFTIEGVQSNTSIKIQNCSNIKVGGCTVRNSVRAGVDLKQSTDCQIIGCDFYDLGNHLIVEGGAKSHNSITLQNNEVVNCHFTQKDMKDSYGGIRLRGPGIKFRNNLIHNFIGQPLTYGGPDQTFTLNEMFNVGVEEGDGGGYYTGPDLTSFGVLFKHNFTHHIMCQPELIRRASIYCDDWEVGETIQENVFYKAGEAFKMNNGGGHTAERNVIVETFRGLFNLGRNTNDGRYNEWMGYLNSSNPANNIKNNLIGRGLSVMGNPGWENGVNSNNWRSRISSFWKNRYGRLNDLINDYDNNNTGGAFQVRLYDNWFNNNQNDIVAPTVVATRNNQQLALSAFENPANLNFKFKSSAPAGVPNIPFQNIGLVVDSLYRPTVPNKDAYRSAVKSRFNGQLDHDPNELYNRLTINQRVYYNTGELVLDGSTTGPTQPPPPSQDPVWEYPGPTAFNGVSDKINLPNPTAGNGATELTISTWVKPDTKSNNKGIITSTGSTYFDGIGNPAESRSNNSWILGPANSVPANQWSHLTSVWKSGQIEKLYIDGIEVANDSNPATGSLNIQEWVVGQDRAISGRFFDGEIRDLKIWTRALSVSEVSAEHNSSLPDTSPPTPNPASFASTPSANGETVISMTATSGSDPSGPVEYFFDETSGNPGGTDSGWQTSSSYSDTGLSAGTPYTYRLRMRDALGNTGSYSASASATTASVPSPPSQDPQWVSAGITTFDGVDDKITLPNPTAANGATELTISTWVRPHTKANNKGIVTSIGATYFGLSISGYGVGNPLESRSNNSWILGPDNSVPVNQWSHLTSVWKSGQIEKLYIDGIEVANDANPATGSLNIQEWVVGQDRNIGGRFFDGDIQDLRIWTRAFSARSAPPKSQLSALHQARSGNTADRHHSMG